MSNLSSTNSKRLEYDAIQIHHNDLNNREEVLLTRVGVFRKHVDFLAKPGDTIGCDFTGVIQDVGSKVTDDWKKGDRIAGLIHGGNEVEPEDGAFGEYCMWKAGLGMKVGEISPNVATIKMLTLSCADSG